jgi:hypothetical protein
MTIRDREQAASLTRWEGEGGAMGPQIRLYHRVQLTAFDNFNMWNFGGVVEALDKAISARVRIMTAHSTRRTAKSLIR